MPATQAEPTHWRIIMLVLNAISLNMIPRGVTGNLLILPLTKEKLEEIVQRPDHWGDLESAIGHADTAALFEKTLVEILAKAPPEKLRNGEVPTIKLPANRVNVELTSAPVIVGQYIGPKLPEGCTTLPEGAEIDWIFVRWDKKPEPKYEDDATDDNDEDDHAEQYRRYRQE